MHKPMLVGLLLVVATFACGTPKPASRDSKSEVAKSESGVSGLSRSDDIRLSTMRSMIEAEYMEKANLALARLVRGQELADQRLYRDALAQVMESIYIFPTADAYAMAGSLYFVMQDRPTAIFYWAKAVEADPQIGRRGYAGLNDWIQTR